MRHIVLCVALLLAAAVSGCGGGGGGGGSVTPQQIIGNYTLVDFEFRYDNGYVEVPEDFYSWYGSLSVAPDGTYFAEWVLNYGVQQDYGYWQQQSNTTALLFSEAYGCTIFLPFRFEDGYLITVNDHQCGNDTRWTNVWRRN